MNPEILEFAKILVHQVRDAAVTSCDVTLAAHGKGPVAARWRAIGAPLDKLNAIVPDVVDSAVFQLLRAIDQGELRLKFVGQNGHEVDLTEEGMGELAGWYMGSGGWRAMFSQEPYVDDFADLVRR
jgi:hypothetical protein